MSTASRKRRQERREASGKTETDEERRARLREDPLVQGLIAEALRTYAQRVKGYVMERDAFARSLGVLIAKQPGGKVVITPAEVAVAGGYKLQTLFDKGTVVHYVIRDEADMAAAALREQAAKSGLVIA